MLKPAVPGSVIDRLDGSSPRRPLEVEELSLVLKKIGLVNCLKKNQAKATYSNVSSMYKNFQVVPTLTTAPAKV